MNARRIDPEKFEVRGCIKHETQPDPFGKGGAVLMDVQFTMYGETMRKPVWFPLSQIHSIHRTFGTQGYDTLWITPWIAKQKGLL